MVREGFANRNAATESFNNVIVGFVSPLRHWKASLELCLSSLPHSVSCERYYCIPNVHIFAGPTPNNMAGVVL